MVVTPCVDVQFAFDQHRLMREVGAPAHMLKSWPEFTFSCSLERHIVLSPQHAILRISIVSLYPQLTPVFFDFQFPELGIQVAHCCWASRTYTFTYTNMPDTKQGWPHVARCFSVNTAQEAHRWFCREPWKACPWGQTVIVECVWSPSSRSIFQVYIHPSYHFLHSVLVHSLCLYYAFVLLWIYNTMPSM